MEYAKKITQIKSRDPLTEKIIACCFKVHSELGPGFNEKIYHRALKLALRERKIGHQAEKEYPIIFQDKKIGSLRLDLIVDERVIVEVKAVTGNIPSVFIQQILSYLKVAKLRIGLLVNFGDKSCQIKRFKR